MQTFRNQNGGTLITGNTTKVREFLLLRFSEVRELQLVQAALFLLVYLAALTGNLLIVAITALDRRLRTPMYFFLRNLSVLDLCFISVTVPKSIHNSLINGRAISLWGCMAQVVIVISFAFSELSLLTAMSYDRYAAICLSRGYGVIMDPGACGKMAAASWLGGGLLGVMYTAGTLKLSFCGSNLVQQFFCDIPSLLKISCSETHVVIDVSIATAFGLAFISFVLIVVSYVRIFRAVRRIPASEGRAKAFSTCLPHLVVPTIFLSTGAVAYLKPTSDSPSTLDLLVSVFYTTVPPGLNPFIYSLRNRDMKASLERVLRGLTFLQNEDPLFLTSLTLLDRRLQTPMYSFLRNLSVINLCYTSVTIPKSILDALINNSSIYFRNCVSQVFLVDLFVALEMSFLAVMSSDRYAAICLPLRYSLIMDRPKEPGHKGRLEENLWLKPISLVRSSLCVYSEIGCHGPEDPCVRDCDGDERAVRKDAAKGDTGIDDDGRPRTRDLPEGVDITKNYWTSRSP
ncbi:olfactory receptor 14A16-like [Tachyglossus aculeatus]|uniref:olfactory receptor 14A16-like n=1 Tax=Tachyglossus aculeatus TaxID=9261 RepID=UPI0018F34B5C|nr:olfactory receptor 14A16-like [Tachyglossus aculeatus]